MIPQEGHPVRCALSCTVLAVPMAIFPWNSFGEQESVCAYFRRSGSATATILNIIVISAGISAINSDAAPDARCRHVERGAGAESPAHRQQNHG